MRDWKRTVRERLDLKAVPAERASAIVEELASYAEDAYRDALSRGYTENDAIEHAWQQVGDWQKLTEEFSGSGPSAQLRGAIQGLEDRERILSRRRGLPRLFADASLDMRFAVRTLKRRPAFAAVVVVALALGIGATTTVFSVAEAALLQDLPYPDAGRLVSIWTERQNSRGQWFTRSLSPPEYRLLQAEAQTLESVALYYYASMALRGQGYPIDFTVGEGTASLSEVSGIRPRLGRWFLPDEVGPEATLVAVLGDAWWRNLFGADPEVIGRTIRLEDDDYRVIGVMPPEFRFEAGLFVGQRSLLSSRDSGERPVWVPLGHNYGARSGSDWYYRRDGFDFEAIARLRPDVTLELAQADIAAVLQSDDSVGPIKVRLAYREDLDVVGLSAQVLLLAVPSVLLLLIACGNVATLLLGEGLYRQAEIATRAALGAGARRIVRQLLTESLLLGLVGSVAGGAVAYSATRLMVAIAPTSSTAFELQVNTTVLFFACFTGLTAGLVFGAFPALTMGWWSKGEVSSRLRGRAWSRNRRTVSVVLGLEVALTVVLLVAGGLFTRTVWNLFAVDNGFDPENLIALRTAIDRWPYLERAQSNQQIIERMEAIPGVEEATGSWSMPMVMNLSGNVVEIEGRGSGQESNLPRVQYNLVYPNYHEVLHIPLLVGRYFTRLDGIEGPSVVLVSESTARRFWPDRSAIGQRLRMGSDTVWSTVVGVVGDVRSRGPAADASSPIYVPYVQNPIRNGIRLVFTARTSVDPAEVIPQLEAAARAVEPDILIRDARVVESVIAETATDERYRALMVVIFGTAAVVIAAVGIFGVVARTLAQRTHEMAIRVALGAEPARLCGLILRGSLYAATAGVIGGLIGAFWASRLLSGFLFGVQSWDPPTYGVVVALVALVSVAASYLPARRIIGLQAAEVLKGD